MPPGPVPGTGAVKTVVPTIPVGGIGTTPQITNPTRALNQFLPPAVVDALAKLGLVVTGQSQGNTTAPQAPQTGIGNTVLTLTPQMVQAVAKMLGISEAQVVQMMQTGHHQHAGTAQPSLDLGHSGTVESTFHAARMAAGHPATTVSAATAGHVMEAAVTLLAQALTGPAANTDSVTAPLPESGLAQALAGPAANDDSLPTTANQQTTKPESGKPEQVSAHLQSLVTTPAGTEMTIPQARELVQLVRHLQQALTAGQGNLVGQLVLASRSVAQLQTVNQALRSFFRLPEAKQAAVMKQFSHSFPLTPQNFAKAVAIMLRATDPQMLLPEGVLEGTNVSPASTTSPAWARLAWVRQASIPGTPMARATLVRQLGAPLAELVMQLPPREAATTRSFLTQTLAGQTTPTQVTQFIKQLLKAPEAMRSAEQMLRAWRHPNAQVRILLVALLKELSQQLGRAEFEQKYVPLLKALARNRQSPKVQSDVIRVLLDMGERQGKGRQEMEALLAEVDFLPTLNRLLKSGDPDLVVEGLRLLARAWNYLASEVRGPLAERALFLAKRHRDPRVVSEALDMLLTHHRDLESAMQTQLLQKGLYRTLMMTAINKYSRGWDHFSDGRQNTRVA